MGPHRSQSCRHAVSVSRPHCRIGVVEQQPGTATGQQRHKRADLRAALSILSRSKGERQRPEPQRTQGLFLNGGDTETRRNTARIRRPRGPRSRPGPSPAPRRCVIAQPPREYRALPGGRLAHRCGGPSRGAAGVGSRPRSGPRVAWARSGEDAEFDYVLLVLMDEALQRHIDPPRGTFRCTGSAEETWLHGPQRPRPTCRRRIPQNQ